MRLALADIKKTISRRSGITRLTPYLLRSGELAREIEALIALYDEWAGRARAGFPLDRAAELIGDYRLARCLTNCLAEDYEWRSPSWPGPANDDEAAALAGRELGSPGQLRLALYDWVNDHAGGYLSAATRESALDACAAELGLRRATLDTLLVLDGDAQAVLHRIGEHPPTADTLARRYNQRAFESLLANAGSVEFIVPHDIGQTAGEPLGTVVKRLCFLARTMGVHYDLSFADDDDTSPPARLAETHSPYSTNAVGETDNTGDGAAETLEATGRPIRVLLYGPQEISAAPAAYGERLARLCRALLGYRRTPERAGTRAALAGSGLRGVAQVYLHGRPLPFALDDRLLKLLGAGTDAAQPDTIGIAETRVTYDSGLEAQFAGESAALERADAAHGWRLEREPEPLLVGETILVPDFALIRGMRRVYLEIAGYWRPGYRERKARKLSALRGRVALAIAAPESARGELGIFEGVFPLLWYTRDHIRAHELIALLDHTYDDSAQRLAALNLPQIAAAVATRGRVAPRESYALLHSYTRAELDAALWALSGDGGNGSDGERRAPVWLDGLGLCDPTWLAEVAARAQAEVGGAPGGRLPLSELAAHLRKSDRLLADLDEATVESLAHRAGLRVARASIFAAEVFVPGASAEPPGEQPTNAEDNPPASARPHRQPSRPSAQPRPRARRKEHRQTGESGLHGQDASLSQLNIFSTEGAEDEGGPGTASTHEE
jgi:predicted nuclease of restriction endonuclease-like RecB superfamily